MRTAVELPEELVAEVERIAAERGLTLRQFVALALEKSISEPRIRRDPPSFGDPNSEKKLTILTPEQLDEAMFG
jgi:hypothetical protein